MVLSRNAWKEDNSVVNETTKHRCEHCDRVFDTKHGLIVHQNRKHKQKRKYVKKEFLVVQSAIEEVVKPQPVKKLIAEVKLSYCPCCGTNIALIAQALSTLEDPL